MRNFFSKRGFILVTIVILFMIFNPSLSSFKNYMIDSKPFSAIYKKTFNGLLFSIFIKKWSRDKTTIFGEPPAPTIYETETYLGILGNFIQLD